MVFAGCDSLQIVSYKNYGLEIENFLHVGLQRGYTHVGPALWGKNFPEAQNTVSLTFSVGGFSEFEIPKPSPPFCHCLLLVQPGANDEPLQPVALPLLTKKLFYPPTLPEVRPMLELLGTQNLQFQFPHSLILPIN